MTFGRNSTIYRPAVQLFGLPCSFSKLYSRGHISEVYLLFYHIDLLSRRLGMLPEPKFYREVQLKKGQNRARIEHGECQTRALHCKTDGAESSTYLRRKKLTAKDCNYSTTPHIVESTAWEGSDTNKDEKFRIFARWGWTRWKWLGTAGVAESKFD